MSTRPRALPQFDAGGSVRQSVALVVALLLAVALAPVAATAASTLVSIVDPTSGSKAHVTDGRLNVGDGTGPLTVNGNVNVANLPNPQPIAGTVTVGAPVDVQGAVDVTNTVTANQGIEPNPWNTFAVGVNSETLTLFDAPPGSSDLAITTLTLTNTGDVTGIVMLTISGNCSPGMGAPLTEVRVPAEQTLQLEYPQPLLAHFATGSACLLAQVSGNGQTKITGVGFSP